MNVDAANANGGAAGGPCAPTYDKIYLFPTYAPKIHRIRLNGDSIQILQTLSIRRPDGTTATGIINPTGFGSTATEVASTDTVQDCANFTAKTVAKDIWGIDCEGLTTDAQGNFWLCEEGGQLTEKVRRKPYSVVLLDEIEKAHPDIFNIMLQVLDDGQLTDGLGRKVDFKNTLIIMTSNIGARQLKDFGAGVGFATTAKTQNAEDNSRGVIEKALKRTFSPEFLNRIDDVIIFNTLDESHIGKIIDIIMKDVLKRLNTLGFTLELTAEARKFIAEKGYDQQFGARPLHRAIQKYLEDPLAEEILNHRINSGDSVTADYSEADGKITFNIKQTPTPASTVDGAE